MDTTPQGEPSPRARVDGSRGHSRALRALLDPTRRTDLLLIWALATWPALLAWLIGAHRTVVVAGVEFAGYWDRPNWTGHIVFLPLALLLFRWAARKIAPVYEEWPPRECPEVVALVDSEDGRRDAYEAMRRAVLSPRNFRLCLIGLVLFHVVDMWEVIAVLLGGRVDPASIREPDWTVMAAVLPDISVAANLLLVGFAYAVQFTLLLVMVQFVVLLLRHNLFFLGRVYQARRVPVGLEDAYILVDLEDPNRCFGFRAANETFNTQVLCLTVAGAGLLFSRFANVTVAQSQALYEALTTGNLLQAESLRALFPDVGQVVTSSAWLASMSIIALPALVKLLPRIPLTGGRPAQRSVVTYLREFFPPSVWPWEDEPSVEEVNAIAGRFAENAFWPTGNNRAAQLFFFSFWVFLLLLFPLGPQSGRWLVFAGFHVLLALLALGLTSLAFQALRWSLSYIDVRLVEAPAAAYAPPPDSVTSLGSRRASPRRKAEVTIGPGARLGEYEVVRHLASGGMGAVYQATDKRLGRDVALKVLPREFVEDAERLGRFEQEAKVLAQLNHPNIATLYAFGQQGTTRYLAMELVDGEPLDQRLAAGALELAEAERVAIQIASALEQAHRRGIVHRDVKPANVMLTANDGAKLLDFGLAKGLSVAASDGSMLETATALTTHGTILGTLHYMSPEQLEGRPIDARSDIFSFGAVLYEMVAGHKAFPGESQATIIGKILRGEPEQLPPDAPAVTSGLAAIIGRCLAKTPAARWGSAREVLDALGERKARPTLARSAAVLPVVGVLPFRAASEDAELGGLAEGVAEELTARLSVEAVGPVVAWQRMLAFAGEADLGAVAAAVNTTHVVQGSIRAAGDRVRVAVQLVDVVTGVQLWAERFDGTRGDLFDLQDELAVGILRALLPRLQHLAAKGS